MYNFELLEKRCKAYYLKKYLKFFILLLLIFGVIATLLYFTLFQTKELPKSKPQQQEVKKIAVEKPIKKIRKIKHLKATKSCYVVQFASFKRTKMPAILWEKRRVEKLLDVPCYIEQSDDYKALRCNIDTDFEDINSYLTITKHYTRGYVVRPEECGVEKKRSPKARTKRVAKVVKKQVVQEKNPQTIELTSMDIHSLEKIFRERKSYNLALRIAKMYYIKKDYKSTLKWTKTANGIDREDAGSWILSAKTRYALGDKEGAKRVLKFYLNYKNSKEVSKLLEKWSGR
jgi:predicted metalloprotease